MQSENSGPLQNLLLYERTVGRFRTANGNAPGTAGAAKQRNHGGTSRLGLLCSRRSVNGGALRKGTVTASRTETVFLEFRIGQLHGNGPPAAIGVGLRVVGHEIKVREVIADRRKSVALIFPA